MTLTNVAKIERKTIIIKNIELYMRHVTGHYTTQSAVRWAARKGRRLSQLTQVAQTWTQVTHPVMQNSDAARRLVTVSGRS